MRLTVVFDGLPADAAGDFTSGWPYADDELGEVVAALLRDHFGRLNVVNVSIEREPA